ncbi:MAG: NAD(P)H-binding protein [Archangium sp.]|nr:NAD(P)H-binding protein [Archangium sp.]
MRLCVLGGHGKTGKRVVDAARLMGHDVRVLEGDALDAAALSHCIHGAEAVISVLGPVSGSAPDFCSRSTERVIEVMRTEGVKRLVMVTGAMCGPREELGLLYRSMLRIPSLSRVIADRAQSERLVMVSDLDWTLVRPPRLNDDEPTTPPVLSSHGLVTMLSTCARVHLAQVLLSLATGGTHVREGVYVRSGGHLAVAA